jgi:hypothetical protein
MEKNGSKSYIAILFGASSFRDLLAASSAREIMEYDSGLITKSSSAGQIQMPGGHGRRDGSPGSALEEYKETDGLSAQREEVETV